MSAHELGWWRKVYEKIWRDPRFIRLSDAEKVFWLYVLTGPQANRIGIFKFSLGCAAEDLGIDLDDVKARLAAVCAAFGWRHDACARVVWIPSWRRYNKTDNPKNLKGFLTDLPDVPDSPLLAEFAEHTGGLSDALLAIFNERVGARLSRMPKSGIVSASPSGTESAIASAMPSDPDEDPDRNGEQDREPEPNPHREREQGYVGWQSAPSAAAGSSKTTATTAPHVGSFGRNRAEKAQQAEAEVRAIKARTTKLLSKASVQ